MKAMLFRRRPPRGLGARLGSARSWRLGFVALLAGLVTCPALADDSPVWEVVRGDVRVLCPMTVGGGFEAKTNALTGAVALATARPPILAGDLAVDLRTLDTGIGLRNEHLRLEYLEVGKGAGFDTATLSDIRLGDVDPRTFQGRTSFTGTFLLHGTRKAIAGQAEIRREGSAVRVEASFPVTLADYGIPKPQYLGVGVKREVQVKVSLVATTVTTPLATLATRSAGGSR